MYDILPTDILAFVVLVCYIAFIRRLSAAAHSPPNTPVVVPYLIPWLGHAYKFAFYRETLFRECRARYGTCFKLIVAGRTFVIVSTPTALAGLHGQSPKVLQAYDKEQLSSVTGLRSRVTFVTAVLRRHVYPIIANRLTKRAMGQITIPLNHRLFATLDGAHAAGASCTLRLDEFVRESFYRASVAAFFGDTSFPDMYAHFAAANAELFYVANHIPILSRKGNAALDRWCAALLPFVERYWEAGTDGYLDGASAFVTECLREVRNAGISPEETTRVLLGVLWGFHAQSIQVSINALAFLHADRACYERAASAVRTTIDAGWPDLEAFLGAEPEVLDHTGFALLDSIFKETLRHSSLALTYRRVLCDTSIVDEDGAVYALRAGESLAGDAYGMHHDARYFANPDAFEGDRFVGKDASYHARSVKSMVPWGGGAYVCKGREYGEYSAKMMLAQLLYLYDFTEFSSEKVTLDADNSLSVARLTSPLIVHMRKRSLR